MYYIFNIAKENTIKTALDSRQGTGTWDFKFHCKFVSMSLVEKSNHDETKLRKVRQVFVLETSFAPEDAIIQASAEIEAEYYTDSYATVHNYLALPDTETAGKTKEELDQLLEV